MWPVIRNISTFLVDPFSYVPSKIMLEYEGDTFRQTGCFSATNSEEKINCDEMSCLGIY